MHNFENLNAFSILIKHVSEKSANEIIDEMKKREVIRDPDKEAA